MQLPRHARHPPAIIRTAPASTTAPPPRGCRPSPHRSLIGHAAHSPSRVASRGNSMCGADVMVNSECRSADSLTDDAAPWRRLAKTKLTSVTADDDDDDVARGGGCMVAFGNWCDANRLVYAASLSLVGLELIFCTLFCPSRFSVTRLLQNPSNSY